MFTTLIYNPLYNALVYLIDVIPGHSAGLAVIILTILIRLALFQLSKSSIKTQYALKAIEPEVEKLKKTVTDRQEQAVKLMALYRENGINPFAGFFLILIQLPIMFGLYRVFQSGLPTIKPEVLYSFVPAPETVSMIFFGIDLAGRSFILALLAVITQFIQINLALPKPSPRDGSFQKDLAHSMNMQMKYIFPLILFPIAYISAVLALYFVTSNVVMTLQEVFVRRRLAKKYEATKKA